MKTINVKTKLTLSLLFLFLAFMGNSQDLTKRQLKQVLENSTERELVQINTSLMISESYYHALLTAEKLLKYNPKSANYNYRKGYALIYSSDDFTKALPYLEVAVSKVAKNYDMVSTRETNAPIEALFFMGRSYHLSNQLEKAIDYYKQYISAANKSDSYIEEAQVCIQQCAVAKKLMKTPLDFKINNIGSVINSEAPEYSAVVSLDGTALYFTSRRLHADSSNIDIKEPGTNLYLEDIYVSYKNDYEEWSKPEMLDFCKPEYNEASIAISIDERRIYAYMDQTGNGDIYYSDSKSNKFQESKLLKDNGVNTNAWETHITVSPDGKKKYFVSNREGGYGGRDIYMIEKIDNDKWSEPMNLGPTINTPYDEDAPFIAIDNKTMYFSSNGPISMGGFDIFKTKLDENEEWSEPENLGYPLNSTSDEIYYTTTVDGTTGYFTSFRPGGYGEKDVYEVKNEHLKMENISVFLGEIVTLDRSEVPADLSFKIKCLDCEEPYEFILYPRFSDGTFYASLYSCKEYEITLQRNKGEKVITKEIIKTDCETNYEEIYRHILLDALAEEIIDPSHLIASYEPLSMKHFFGYNKNVLDPNKGALNIFLDSLNSQIDNGRTFLEIEINASASKVPTRSYKNNEDLAEKRARGVKNFLADYFTKVGLADSIKLNLNKIVVSGPDYNSDFKEMDKYLPFQFVELSLSGINSIGYEASTITSVDKNIESDVVNKRSTTTHQYTDSKGDLFTSGEMIEADYDFHVIIGVFQKLVFAEGMVKTTKQKGFNAEIIGKRNGMHVVSAGKANSKAEATKILNRVRKEVVQSAWILNIKK